MKERYTLLDRALDHMYELRGAWDWKKNEPRNRNQADYHNLCDDIQDMEELLDRKPDK